MKRPTLAEREAKAGIDRIDTVPVVKCPRCHARLRPGQLHTPYTRRKGRPPWCLEISVPVAQAPVVPEEPTGQLEIDPRAQASVSAAWRAWWERGVLLARRDVVQHWLPYGWAVKRKDANTLLVSDGTRGPRGRKVWHSLEIECPYGPDDDYRGKESLRAELLADVTRTSRPPRLKKDKAALRRLALAADWKRYLEAAPARLDADAAAVLVKALAAEARRRRG